MSTCPWCGERVPFGGGKTARNAAKLMDEAGVVEDAMKLLKKSFSKMDPPQEMPQTTLKNLQSFVTDGQRHALTFHNYAHKWSMDQPDWAAAGWWSRHAKELMAGLERDLTTGEVEQ
jgi:hypothetical protein